jgi:tRNA pseudouridine32 synthase/23S rRNA pseudouridine746 synthase
MGINDPASDWILWVDDHCIVVHKPSGLPSVPGRVLLDCAASRVQARWPDAKVVHRLDMDTSGLLLFARGLEAQRRLSLAFEQRRVDKQYVALVAGNPPENAGTVDLPLRVDWPNRPRQIVDQAQGKPAVTHWRVLERLPRVCRVELTPITGRSHQLRVHLAALGHPILGDPLYAPADVQAQAPRLCLHATALAFDHPVSGNRVQMRCDVPF